MYPSTAALVSLAVVLVTIPFALSAPLGLLNLPKTHIGILSPNLNIPIGSGSNADPTPTSNAGFPLVQGQHSPPSPGFLPPFVTYGVEKGTATARDIDYMLARALDNEDDVGNESDALSFSKLKGIASVLGNTIGIGSNVIDLFHNGDSQPPATSVPTNPTASPFPTAVGSLPINPVGQRDFQDFVPFVARATASAQYDDQESGASVLGPLTKSIASFLNSNGGLDTLVKGSSIASDVTGVLGSLHQAQQATTPEQPPQAHDLFELLAREDVNVDPESGAFSFSSIVNTVKDIFNDGEKLTKLGKAAGIANDLTGAAANIKSAVAPQPTGTVQPNPAVTAPAQQARNVLERELYMIGRGLAEIGLDNLD